MMLSTEPEYTQLARHSSSMVSHAIDRFPEISNFYTDDLHYTVHRKEEGKDKGGEISCGDDGRKDGSYQMSKDYKRRCAADVGCLERKSEKDGCDLVY